MSTSGEPRAPGFDFGDAFEALTGHRPFPWQRRLFDAWRSGNGVPSAVDIPTGLGKTAVMAVWLLARGAGAALPRRLVYVVDRRAVVDQATGFAVQLRGNLESAETLGPVRRGLGLRDGASLPISTLRGRYADNREWMADPSASAIIVGTVDMVGSRLLFEGYGVSRRMRPYAAGLMGCDSLVLLDEAHLARPFERLLQMIEKGQRVSSTNGADAGAGEFVGPAASASLPPPFRVLPLSATLGHDTGSESFGLDEDDYKNETVLTRLDAEKVLTVEPIEDDKRELADELAEQAWQLMWEESEALGKPVRVVVYCDFRKVAEQVKDDLARRVKDVSREEGNEGKLEPEVILFVGGRRVYEREEADRQLKECGLVASDEGPTSASGPVFLVATSAGEVGVDLDADHMVCDVVAWERMVQRLGRVNRRGKGKARVLVIDGGSSKDQEADSGSGFSRDAVRYLLKSLPRDGAGGHRAGPAALIKLRDDPDLHTWIADATTRPPLYPALTRPLVDAWAMTSLAENAGRPEVGPWLRGWVDDEAQTTLVWRDYLPVRFGGGDDGVRMQGRPEVEDFFEAAPPHAHEFLETETRRVVEWLGKRAKRLLKPLADPADTVPADDDQGVDDGDEAVGGGDPRAPMRPDTPVAFLLDGANRPGNVLSLAAIEEQKRERTLHCLLAGKRLVVDARFGGIEDGLLADGPDKQRAPTLDNNWGREDSEEDQRSVRIGVLPEAERAKRLGKQSDAPGGSSGFWREVLALPYRVSGEDEPVTWLTVEKRRVDGGGEEARAIATKVQLLDEHQAWAAKEAERIAEEIGLDEEDRTMLVAAAAHHDDGKKASRWQRAFNAKEDGPYGKTAGPFNRHVLNGYRHELKSALDAEKDGLDGIDRSGPRFDLALHLIAAHHGHARPGIGVEGYDDLPPSATAVRAHRIGLRFARLQRQWGPWGLAWWEALLRAADQSASRRLEESGAAPGGEEAG